MLLHALCNVTFLSAKSYEMRISEDIHQLQGDFDSCEILVVHGKEMTPKESGNVEKLTITLSSNDSYTSTAYFAVAAIDEDGNRGEPSNILPITMATTFNYEGNPTKACCMIV